MALQRIRNGDRIIGYLRHDLNHVFFSKDMFWWNGHIPAYNEVDTSIGRRDARGRELFEHDIVRTTFRPFWKKARLMRTASRGGQCWLLDLDSNFRVSTDDPAIERLEFVSHTFLNLERIYGAEPR